MKDWSQRQELTGGRPTWNGVTMGRGYEMRMCYGISASAYEPITALGRGARAGGRSNTYECFAPHARHLHRPLGDLGVRPSHCGVLYAELAEHLIDLSLALRTRFRHSVSSPACAIHSETTDAPGTYLRLPDVERHPSEDDETEESAKTCSTRLPGAVVHKDRLAFESPDGRAVWREWQGVENEVVSSDRDREHRTTEKA